MTIEQNNSNLTESLFSNAHKRLDVVKADFLEVDSLSWEELFDGYDNLYAITYSGGIDFICKLMGKFKNVQVIFGFEGVISYTLQEIIAYQTKTIERIKDSANKNKTDLLTRIDDNSLKLFVSRKQLSHEKLYVLRSEGGETRVITGSANMSFNAFSGRQRENIICMESKRAFEWYSGVFDSLKENSCDEITKKALFIKEDEIELETIPLSQTVIANKVLTIETAPVDKDEINFALDVKNLSAKLAPFMPKTAKNGLLQISPEMLKQTRNKLVDSVVREKELRNEYPQLIIDIDTQDVALNGKTLNLSPSKEEITRDAELFLEYMKGYEKFHGDVNYLKNRYYEFAVWFFATPFFAKLRNTAVLYNQNLFPYPVFGLVYGQSKAGKTTFLETLLKMMIGQKTKIAAPDFTRAVIEQLKRTVKGAPIIVDDLTQTRFTQHAVETIKNDEFGVLDRLDSYPAVVISANEDVKAVAPEIIRRTVICRVQAGLKNTEIMRNNTVRYIQKNIGTAFYREYLRQMLLKIPEIIDELKSEEGSPDILAVSSEIIYNILQENTKGELPSFVRSLTLETYFSEKVTGSHAIKSISDAWKINRKLFVVDKKFGELRYNAAQTWEADRIIKELPEDLRAVKTREWVIMDLDKACDFFDIDFKHPLSAILFGKNKGKK